MVLKFIWVFYTLIFVSAQRWYRIELKVLFIVFSDKEFHVVLEGRKKLNWVLVTQKERRSLHKRIYSLLRTAWKEKYSWILIQGKEDRAIRDCFEKYLLCTLYQVEFILSSFKVVISHTCLIWPTSD